MGERQRNRDRERARHRDAETERLRENTRGQGGRDAHRMRKRLLGSRLQGELSGCAPADGAGPHGAQLTPPPHGRRSRAAGFTSVDPATPTCHPSAPGRTRAEGLAVEFIQSRCRRAPQGWAARGARVGGAPSIPDGGRGFPRSAPVTQKARASGRRPASKDPGWQRLEPRPGVGVLAVWPGPQFLYLQSGVIVPTSWGR